MYRKAANLTQLQLGEILKVDYSYLGKIERAETNATLEMIENIASALRISPYELFDSPSRRNEKSDLIDKINTTLLSFNKNELKTVSNIIKDVHSLTNKK
jgi:Helix-turn-helix.